MRPATYRTLVAAAAILAFVVVVVGAFVRLSDAGLGCPDWPWDPMMKCRVRR